MHSASMPRICRNLVIRSVEPLVLQKAMHRSKPVSFRIFSMASALPSWGTSMRNCLMSGLFCSSSRTVISAASRWYTQAMSMTSREIVAEKSPRFFRLFILSSRRVTSWMKPMSSIRSASSSTTVCAVSTRTVRRFMWSESRPGVATTIWGCFFSVSICRPMGAPP